MEGRESVVVTVTGGGGGAGEVEPLHPLLPSETPPTPIPVSSSTTTSLSPPPVPATSSPSPLAPPPVAEGGSVLTSMPSSDVKLETPTQNKATEGEVMAMKKKRGRPRKYGADGSVLFNPIPISASMPPSGEFTLTSLDGVMLKRGRGRPIGSATKHQSFHRRNKFNQQLRSPAEFDSSDLATTGGVVACSSGANLTPHIITVAAGEDVTMKIISFSQKGSHAICILSANGVISNVTLRQPDSSGGTLTYEGRFELLSLSGCFKPSETGGARNLSGGMSVSLAGPDGRVVGGGLAGLLVAAGPVQVVVGSFMPSNPHSNKGADVVRAKKKKSDTESFSMNAPMATVGTGRSIVDIDESYGILRGGQQRSSGSPRGNNNMTSSRTADNNRSAPAVTNTTDVNGSQLPAVTGAGAGSEFQTSQVRIMGFHFTETEFQSCTGSKMFARLMAASAPFTDYQHALLAAKDIWLNKVDVNGWLESFAAHPEIGTNKPISQRCKDEQKSAFETATDSAMEELLEWNSRYKDKFRFIFIICASGRGMPEILDQLKKRFQNRPIVELDIAIGEEMKIIELRLAKLFKDDPVEKLKDVSGGGSIQHHRPRITTHVLDVSRGCPASGVEVYLEMWKDSHKCPSLINGDPSKWVLQGSSHTDRDGRSGPLMSIVDHTNPGFYRLSFNTGKYASSCFYPYVSIVFEVKERQRSEHFHVPLLFSPFSFSTYRGS